MLSSRHFRCLPREKIVFDLLSNAFKFIIMGEITISLRSIEAVVELTVRDTETGISAAERYGSLSDSIESVVRTYQQEAVEYTLEVLYEAQAMRSRHGWRGILGWPI
jgi:hypothetical protein